MVLSWAARSTNFNDANAVVTDTGVTAAVDADGNPVVLDASGNAVLSGVPVTVTPAR